MVEGIERRDHSECLEIWIFAAVSKWVEIKN